MKVCEEICSLQNRSFVRFARKFIRDAWKLSKFVEKKVVGINSKVASEICPRLTEKVSESSRENLFVASQKVCVRISKVCGATKINFESWQRRFTCVRRNLFATRENLWKYFKSSRGSLSGSFKKFVGNL